MLGGGIGAGKSQVAGFLGEYGATIIVADHLGHAVLEPDGPAFAAVADRWPSVVVDGRIDRSKLAAIVFSEPSELSALEEMTHPHILAAIAERTAAAAGTVVVEAPVMLPLEGTWIRVFVDADEQKRIDHAAARTGDPDDVRRRAASQADRGDWLAWADEVVENNGDVAELRTAVERLWEKLVERIE